MNESQFLTSFVTIMAECGNGLRVEGITRGSSGSELVIASDTALAQQEFMRLLRRDEVERLLASWTDGDLVVSVRGLDQPPEPTILVREGALFIVSGEGESNAGPEEYASFAAWFQALIGAPSPVDLELVRLDEHLWGSANALGHDVEGFPHVLRIPSLDSYTLVGHAGYGSNSYAVYVTQVQGDTRMYLRLPWGGAYMDEAEERPRLLENLREGSALFEQATKKNLPMCLNNNMGIWFFSATPELKGDDRSEWANLNDVHDYLLNAPNGKR